MELSFTVVILVIRVLTCKSLVGYVFAGAAIRYSSLSSNAFAASLV